MGLAGVARRVRVRRCGDRLASPASDAVGRRTPGRRLPALRQGPQPGGVKPFKHPFSRRARGYKFKGPNPACHSFADYLAAFRSKRRVQIKRDRRELEAQGIVITAPAGDAIPDDLFEPMFRLYKST